MTYTFGNVSIIANVGTFVSGVRVPLSPTQQRVIEYLASANGQPVTSDEVRAFLQASNFGKAISDSGVKVAICDIRKRFARINSSACPIESLEGAYVIRAASPFHTPVEKRPRFSNSRNESMAALTRALSAIVNAPSTASYADRKAVELAAAALTLGAQWVRDTRELSRVAMVREVARLQDRLDANPPSAAGLALSALASGLEAVASCQYVAADRNAKLAELTVTA